MPINKEKHFMVTEVEYNEDGAVIFCLIEAVMSKRTQPITWRDLKNANLWVQGWQ